MSLFLIRANRCEICGHIWVSEALIAATKKQLAGETGDRVGSPLRCAKCKSPYWNKDGGWVGDAEKKREEHVPDFQEMNLAGIPPLYRREIVPKNLLEEHIAAGEEFDKREEESFVERLMEEGGTPGLRRLGKTVCPGCGTLDGRHLDWCKEKMSWSVEDGEVHHHPDAGAIKKIAKKPVPPSWGDSLPREELRGDLDAPEWSEARLREIAEQEPGGPITACSPEALEKLREICAGNIRMATDFDAPMKLVDDPQEVDLCGFKSYNEVDGENYICGREKHGPKTKHGEWIKV